MNYLSLGTTPLRISRIALGCMGFGDPAKGKLPWVLGEQAATPIIRRALELGINFFDTANMYSDGASEEILGRAIKEHVCRQDVVIATKVGLPYASNKGGLSRASIMAEVDASLGRLQTDYIDLYQIHRWDYGTPIEETLGALDDVVRAGKARYIGASSMAGWQFGEALYLQERNHWTRFVSMQNHYNLLYREEEREMVPLCRDKSVAVLPWSPLARGLLSRPWAPDNPTNRLKTDPFSKRYYSATAYVDRCIVDRLDEVSHVRGTPMARVALAWLLKKPGVTAPVVGVTDIRHLEDAVAALDLDLSGSEMTSLEELYIPHPVAGFDGNKESDTHENLMEVVWRHVLEQRARKRSAGGGIDIADVRT